MKLGFSFYLLHLWMSSIHIIDCYLRKSHEWPALDSELWTFWRGSRKYDPCPKRVTALALVGKYFNSLKSFQIQDSGIPWSRKRTILSLNSGNVVNILLSKKWFGIPDQYNFPYCSYIKLFRFYNTNLQRELLDLFFPFLLLTKFFFFWPGVMWNSGLLDVSEI